MIQNYILELFGKAETHHQNELLHFRRNGGTWRNKQKLFEIEMNARGFILVGVGMYSSVWRLHGRLYKINSNINGVYDGFYNWMLECIKHPGNPCLPQFGELVQVGQRFCVEVAPMQQQFTIRDADSLYSASRTNRHLREAILLAVQTCANESDVSRGMFDKLSPEKIDAKLIRTFLDVHAANIMRLNGQVVLNDPIAYLANQIPVFEVAEYA
ncbi:hypothetical protein D3C76_102990 [compost metagenome]